jgi:Tfp pilus assembly protein PilV
MVAAGIMSIVMMGFLSMQTVQQRSMLVVQTSISRNMLQLQLQQALVSSAALTNTQKYSNNTAFANCYAPGTGTTCMAGTNLPFDLLGPMGSAPIAGAGSGSKVYYDYTGAPCTTPSPQCLFQVYATYNASCASGTSCDTPTALTAQYTIQQVPGITPVGGTPLKTLTSSAIALSTSGGSGGATNRPWLCHCRVSGSISTFTSSQSGKVCVSYVEPNFSNLIEDTWTCTPLQ